MNPVAPHWQLDLTSSSDAELVLVAWRSAEDKSDGGVPLDIANIIARTLAAHARVSFLSSEACDVRETSTLCVKVALNPIERLHARIKHEPVRIQLVSTADPNVASRIFYEDGFSWQMQGQIVLLLPAASNPPLLDRKGLGMLMECDWEQALAKLGLRHLLGVMRPGVDGDVAGIWSFDKAFTQALLAGLLKEAQREDYEFLLVSEEKFMALLAN
jgi:hypothetical protein